MHAELPASGHKTKEYDEFSIDDDIPLIRDIRALNILLFQSDFKGEEFSDPDFILEHVPIVKLSDYFDRLYTKFISDSSITQILNKIQFSLIKRNCKILK